MSTVMPTDARSARNPDVTRGRILEAAFREIYLKGFQGMRLDEVLRETGLTKGALYHHFPNKLALGYTVVDELIYGMVEHLWLIPLATTRDPITTITRVLQEVEHSDGPFDLIEVGCPLNNLAQEMSPLDEGFRQRINVLFERWRGALAEALQRGVQAGTVRADINAETTATFLLASIEGCIGMAKNAQSLDLLKQCRESLSDYLNGFRA